MDMNYKNLKENLLFSDHKKSRPEDWPAYNHR